MQNFARYKTYTLSPAPSATYPDTALELSDNRDVTAAITDPRWVGWSAGTPEIILDLGSSQTFKRVRILALKVTGSSVNIPSTIVVETGASGSGPWNAFGTINPSAGLADNSLHYLLIDKLAGQTDRFVRVVVTRNGATTMLLAEVQVWDDALPLLLDLPEDPAPLSSVAEQPISPAPFYVGFVTANAALIGDLLASQGQVCQVSSPPLPPLLPNVSFASSIVSLINASGGAKIVSQSERYENGFIVIDFVLDRIAGISAWLRKGNNLISDVYDSLTPSLQHTLRIPAPRFESDSEVIVVSEIVNL